MTLVLLEKGLVLEGSTIKIEDTQVPGISWIMTVYLHTCHHISRPGPGYVISGQAWTVLHLDSRQSLPRQSDRGKLEKKCHWLLPFSRTPWHHQITINIYQPIHNSFAGNTNLMSLSIIVHHCLVYSIAFLFQRLFSPNRNSSRQGKTASLGKLRNIVWRIHLGQGGCTWAFPRHP